MRASYQNITLTFATGRLYTNFDNYTTPQEPRKIIPNWLSGISNDSLFLYGVSKVENNSNASSDSLAKDKIIKMTKADFFKYLKKIDGWDVKSNQDKSFYLIKEFTFKNFMESQSFVNKIGDIAEEENHHPDISFGWGYCKVKIFTHAIKGLAESDFILAAKIDKI